MIQIKKTILTLVALLAVTTGAWADGIVCTASDLGKVLCTDGSIYENVSAATTAGKTAAAVIAYVDETNKNGLAIALADEASSNWSTAKSTCEDKPAVSGAAWLLPSQDQWMAMLVANGGEYNCSGLNKAITTAGGTALQEDVYYWSSTEGGDLAYAVFFDVDDITWDSYKKNNALCVRACLAFDIAAASTVTTVTFTASDLADGSSITKDGVTLTANGQYGINMNGVNGPGEFTNSLGGNFTKIVVTADNLPSGDGWSAGTWTGSASSVSFTGNIESWKTEFSIVCTLETASSTVEVAWNKTSKTGTFTMPGGNVELEPEYYPQAALTAAPTAINDVPATTDGAIVNAGTVANIDGTTTAQGTVMYYAVQSATAPTAPDYDATGWTDKVPTATDFKEGNVYVWYYVKGADGDETSTFNDGDITKLGESGYITLLAAPTYAVTFADDTAEPDKWTASPNANVTKGQPVTVTYSGTKKVLGVKAEKKAPVTYPMVSEATAADYGKVVCAAGHLHDAKTAVPSGCTAVGILGKVTETGHGLILALQYATTQTWNTINGWESVTTYAGTTLKLLPDATARGSLTSYTALGSTTVSDWAVAQKSDYEAIFINLGSTNSDEDGTTYDGNVNAYITTGVGGTAISGTSWSATAYNGTSAWNFAQYFWNNLTKTNSYSVRPVLAF